VGLIPQKPPSCFSGMEFKNLFAFTKIASCVGTYQHEWLQTEGFFHKLKNNPLFS
jgi:hypothetical protein